MGAVSAPHLFRIQICARTLRTRGFGSGLIIGGLRALGQVNNLDRYLKDNKIRRNGVYLAHDSMGYARYIGRGRIFQRLRARLRSQILELKYFSFYVVEERKHEGEIETLLIRAAGPLLQFNTKKKRVTISTGRLLDYEAGTQFFERRYKKGKRPKRNRPRHTQS